MSATTTMREVPGGAGVPAGPAAPGGPGPGAAAPTGPGPAGGAAAGPGGGAPPGAGPKRPRRAPRVLAAAALGLGAVGALAYAAGRGKESTDDAFLESHVAIVASRVSGQIASVPVKDNQRVAAGDLLVELDDRDARARLATAEADLLAAQAGWLVAEKQFALVERNAQAELRQAEGGLAQAAGLAGRSRAEVAQEDAETKAAEARRELAALDFERSRSLHADGAVSPAELDAKKAALDQAEAALAQARSRVAGAHSSVGGAAGALEAARGRLLAAGSGPEQLEVARAGAIAAAARVAQAEAAVEQARLNLSYAAVRAPFAGVVSRRTAEVGQAVEPSRPLLAVTALDDVWVVANFKEVQVAAMREGQPARVAVDAFAGRALRGHVESLAGGSGARFALLPPDNASGNFTKVVQRIPVLVRLDERPEGLVLRPGMSADVTVTTR